MLYLASFINLIKNVLVKLWSHKPVRFVVMGYFAYYCVSGFYTTAAARATNLVLEFPGWEALMPTGDIGFNPDFIKSRKATAGVWGAAKMLGSVFGPGLAGVAVLLYLQKMMNTYMAPPLPVLYCGEDAEDIIVDDYRMPVLYTKGEAEYDEDEEEELEEQEQDNMPEKKGDFA